MMKLKISVLLLVCSSIVAFAQTFSSHPVALTPTAYPSVNFNKEAYKEKLNAKFSAEPNKKLLDRYIKQDMIGQEYFFSSNQIYSNWPEATEYVKKVFEKSIPKELNTGEVKIYIVRDPSPNAFCMEDGNIAVTVGLLYFMNNEADLAATLSHEFGHYYSNHLYTDYKKKDKNKYIKAILLQGGGGLMVMKNLSSFQQDQERQADTFATNFFMKNGYDPKEIAESFTVFKKLTNKYKKLSYYRKPLFYFSSHPSDDERIENAQSAFANKSISGKKYQVDSVAFFAIKKRAIDETIYLLFEQLQYDECLEMAYLQYLYHPNDEFYLFFITECLRRKMILEPGSADQLFITDNYSKLSRTQNEKVPIPVFLKGKYSGELSRSNYERSVFCNLKNEIFNLSDNDVQQIKAKELLRTDTLEFLFNEDALAYFSSKIPKNACVFNVRRLLLGEPPMADCGIKTNNTELENDYSQIIIDYQNIKQNVETYKKAPLIFFDITTIAETKYSSREFYDAELSNELYNAYDSLASLYPNEIIDTKNKFNFREIQKIKSTSLFVESLGLKGFFGKKETTCDFLTIFPEVSHEINKFNYKKLIFLGITVVNAVPDSYNGAFSGMMKGNEEWIANIYIIDLANKKIIRRVKPFNRLTAGGDREDKINAILNACMRAAKE